MVRLRRHPARADGPQHALGFFLIDAAISLAGHVTDRRTAISLVTLTFFVLAIGLTGLLGYLLAPDLLVGWARSARMAVHTATGMLLASVGPVAVLVQERLVSRGDALSGGRDHQSLSALAHS